MMISEVLISGVQQFAPTKVERESLTGGGPSLAFFAEPLSALDRRAFAYSKLS